MNANFGNWSSYSNGPYTSEDSKEGSTTNNGQTHNYYSQQTNKKTSQEEPKPDDSKSKEERKARNQERWEKTKQGFRNESSYAWEAGKQFWKGTKAGWQSTKEDFSNTYQSFKDKRAERKNRKNSVNNTETDYKANNTIDSMYEEFNGKKYFDPYEFAGAFHKTYNGSVEAMEFDPQYRKGLDISMRNREKRENNRERERLDNLYKQSKARKTEEKNSEETISSDSSRKKRKNLETMLGIGGIAVLGIAAIAGADIGANEYQLFTPESLDKAKTLMYSIGNKEIEISYNAAQILGAAAAGIATTALAYVGFVKQAGASLARKYQTSNVWK